MRERKRLAWFGLAILLCLIALVYPISWFVLAVIDSIQTRPVGETVTFLASVSAGFILIILVITRK